MQLPGPSGTGDLAFRRQFVLGPDSSDAVPTWRRHRVADDRWLSVHPDLPRLQVELGGRSLTLLGFVLDPRHPDRDDETILRHVLQTSRTFDEVVEAFDPLGGRWAAIHVAGTRVHVVHDPAGLRQVYHGRDQHGRVWCGSSPALVARLTGQPEDAALRADLLDRGLIEPRKSHFWPGTSSAFVGVERLLPNHHLDARSGHVQRYWPRAPIPPVAVEEATETCATTLSGVMATAAARYPLALALTAGLDSRLLLAASRGCAERLSFYTLMKPGMNLRSPDVRVPRAMLKHQRLHHRVIPVRPRARGPVADVIRSTFQPWHESTACSAQAMYDDPPRPDGSWVTVNGNVSEIARCGYPRVEMTPESLVRAAHLDASAFAVEQFGEWYAGAAPVIARSGIDPWELFYWEHRIGAWLGTVRTEFDVVEEGLTPYNSRALIQTMLGVDRSLRRYPHSEFQRGLISHLWDELLSHPVNPPASRIKAKVKAITPRAVLARRNGAKQPSWR